MIPTAHDAVARLAMLSGPQDHCVGGTQAPWLSVAGDTTPEHFFGLGRLEDPEIQQQLDSWSLMGMDPFGTVPSVNIDKHDPPYENAHELKTDALPQTGDYADAHRSIAVDGTTPIVAGEPLFAPAWRYLLGP